MSEQHLKECCNRHGAAGFSESIQYYSNKDQLPISVLFCGEIILHASIVAHLLLRIKILNKKKYTYNLVYLSIIARRKCHNLPDILHDHVPFIC